MNIEAEHRRIILVISFGKKIKIIEFNQMKDFPELNELPDTCPVCNKGISPEFVLVHSYSDFYKHLVCKCPISNCQEIFIVYYTSVHSSSGGLEIFSYSPTTKLKKEFDIEILELSPDFVEIYNQAYLAEQDALHLICGVGYRKSLEYLIKDYAIKIHPDEIEKIKSQPLAQCISKYIENQSIKEMSKYAVWIGNDETHFVRKWENKDLKDLKQLITLTVHYISMEIMANNYQTEMNK